MVNQHTDWPCVPIEVGLRNGIDDHIAENAAHTLNNETTAPAQNSCSRKVIGALYVSGEPLLYNNMARVLPLVMAPGKLTVGTYPEWGRAGLLMSYSADLIDDVRRAGIYAVKVLGGEKPADLPIEQASKFVFVLNLKTAKSLGVTPPDRLLTLADEVIE